MNRKYLVSEIFENALSKCFDEEQKDIVKCESDGYVNVIRCLIYIYGDLDFINPNLTKDTKALIENLSRFGYSKNDIYSFFNYFNRYDLFNVSKSLIDMYQCKKNVLNLGDCDLEKFYNLLKNIVNIESNKELYDYYENKLKNNNNIEFLEIEPLIQEKNNKSFSFQLDAVNGFVSIMSILIFIAVVCIGIIVINVLVG